jgi:hypothetical protein
MSVVALNGDVEADITESRFVPILLQKSPIGRTLVGLGFLKAAIVIRRHWERLY